MNLGFGSRFGLGARTGGLNQKNVIDDLTVQADFENVPLRFTRFDLEEGGLRLEWSGGGILELSTDVLGPWLEDPAAQSGILFPFVPEDGETWFFRLRR